MSRSLSAVILSLAFSAPAFAQDASSPGGYCFSDPAASTVYFSGVFAVPNVRINPSQMTREFHGYLQARYGFTTNSNYPVSCGIRESVAASEGARVTFEGQTRHDQKQVVETEWKYLPSASAAGLMSSDGHVAATSVPQPDHGVCFSEVATGPEYVSAVFDAVAPVSIAQWNMTLMKFLSGKYGYKGPVECDMVTLDNAQGLEKAWEDGARAGGRSVVETGWKYDAAATTAPAPAVDEDREPARPAPGTPAAASTDARARAGKEAPAALQYCQADRLLSVVFNCLAVQQAVIAYRVAHAGDAAPVPLADLFTADRLDCTHCLDNSTQKAWARREALAHQMKMPVANCVSQHFLANLRAKPYPNRIREHYEAAVAACKG